jgi:predicted MFS family arabinose efflux permease
VSERSGARLWVPIGGMALAVGLTYLVIFSVPPLITVFVDDLGLSHAQAGALMSVCLAAFLVGSLVSGRLAARFRAGPVVVAGVALCGIGTLCFPLSDELPALLSARALVGFGGGLVYAPGVTFVTSLLPPRRANVGVGVFLCGLSIGSTIAFFATKLIEEALDWRWPSWIYGAATLFGALGVFALSGTVRLPGQEVRASAPSYRSVLAHPVVRALCATVFVGLFVAYGVFTWIPPYLEESAGFSTAQVSLAGSLMALAGIPATFGFGWLADRTGRPMALAAVGLSLPLSLSVFAATTSPAYTTALLVAVLSALGVAGGLGPVYALPVVILGARAGATASGLAAASAMAGAVVSTYLGGWLVGESDGYGRAFSIYAAGAAVAAFALVPVLALAVRRKSVNAIA